MSVKKKFVHYIQHYGTLPIKARQEGEKSFLTSKYNIEQKLQYVTNTEMSFPSKYIYRDREEREE